MKTHIPLLMTFAVVAGLVLTARGADEEDQSAFPQVTAQPIDQQVDEGSNVVLSVQATNVDSFQWIRNGVVLDSQTNNSLVLTGVSTNDVALYSCEVSKGAEVVPTRAASLNVVVSAALGGPIVVFGTPVLSGGAKNSCPGAYIGYVNYTKTVSQGWGWSPSSVTPHTAADGSGRTDTKVEYVGKKGDNGCDQTIVTLPNSPFSSAYRFTIYFTNNVPSGPYPLSLNGFNP
jgi:hypothetical protein